ncbi:MAG: AFG1 family ATPase [Gammaproteobacteria bacterium]|nr:AFG1 family ATPase [Gammaproteobacteria bacterium]MYI77009.1 AFG1 family ATPase [Gammaproteobacteria bacterium]
MELDPSQQPIADELARLATQLERSEATPRWQRALSGFLSNRNTARIQGLYIWGGVGRGKTYLMDRFFAQVRIERKTRVHFHRFMQLIHRQLVVHSATENPLEVITTNLSKDTRVLCFDEFVVSDIGDAMILAELLKHMFQLGIVLVATSNIEPQDLYKNGLQRRRFLPAIELLKEFCQVIHLNGPIDYRLRALKQTDLYRIGTELSPELRVQDMLLFGGNAGESGPILEINDRNIETVFSELGVVGFTFQELCVAPKSAPDYIEIARLYHTLFIYQVPQLTATMEDAAKRFINLVDVLYDYNVNFVVQAASSITDLYKGTRYSKEFERTVSRLVEMASEAFLSRAHRV